MKILITGEKSYIGNSFKKYLEEFYNERYEIDKISLRNSNWQVKDFSKYDAILHVAGIVHAKSNAVDDSLYYAVNRDLTYQLAKKAKQEKVKQFIFLSTMSVYGVDNGTIYEDTIPSPVTLYGKSKLEAEKLLKSLSTSQFVITIVRPPMVYGKGCGGNYKKLSKISSFVPVFPKYTNSRSMIFIENLVELIRILAEDQFEGVYCPQNEEYVNTSNMVELIAKENGRKIKLTNKVNFLIKLALKRVNLVNKIFGTLVYDKNLSTYNKPYNLVSFEESISKAEADKSGI
ncbi:NAD-dependent epimerase/dehydratase family protein [Marinilactibacillus kalidii]|uniref:NAD-dependent epimerase/dehydratase family protein n=1 Tax=Marinilactibacillus kalidii TaxID=2820274 RepID=UPI001ABDFF5C|nr:NAD-dependent epimerase/dehydratase family protein [Marinilactibacillus kalidii]